MKISILYTWIAFAAFASSLAQATPVDARPACPALDGSTKSKVAEYVAARYHAGTAHDLSLKDLTQANDDCYWRFEYEQLSTRRTITLYLAPDHKYLTTTLFDQTSDPFAEERKEREETQRALIGSYSATSGPANSAVTIVEFSDFQCPYCQRLANLIEHDVLPGEPDVKVVFRNFPLPMHPWAEQAAEMLACAQMQSSSSFWKLHDYVFKNQRELSQGNLNERLVAAAGTDTTLNQETFHACIDQGYAVGPVRKDIELGKKYGVHATPTIFINGTKIEGVRDAAQMKDLIAQAKAGTLAPSASATQTVAAARTTANSAACAPAQ